MTNITILYQNYIKNINKIDRNVVEDEITLLIKTTREITSVVRSKDKLVAYNLCNSSRCKTPWLLDR